MHLVTGGAGFVGSHLVERLVRDGERVRILDERPPTGPWFENLPASQVEVITGDIRDTDTVRKAAEHVDVIFHQAAISSVWRSIEHPQETVEVNIGGTLNVLEAARSAGTRRVVFASSAAVYGDGPESPKVETLPPRPLSPYAVSKLAGEQLCAVYSRLHGVETVALRYFNVYGPRQDPSSPYSGVISRFVDAIQRGEPVTIYGDGTQTRDFVYITDVVEANILAASAENVSGEVFNIGTGVATSLKGLEKALSRITGLEQPPLHLSDRAGDIRRSTACIDEATRALGFRPVMRLDCGLARMFAAL